MNENTFVDSFFFRFDLFVSLFFSLWKFAINLWEIFKNINSEIKFEPHRANMDVKTNSNMITRREHTSLLYRDNYFLKWKNGRGRIKLWVIFLLNFVRKASLGQEFSRGDEQYFIDDIFLLLFNINLIIFCTLQVSYKGRKGD